MGGKRVPPAATDPLPPARVAESLPPTRGQFESADAGRRYVLPKDLPNAVKHLSDRELDLLVAASVEEAQRRGRPVPSVKADNRTSKQSPLTEGRRQAESETVTLTRGQISAVRASFKAGIKPSLIARQFGISQSDVRKVLASDMRTRE
jgi:hypothetical protein